MDYTIPSKMSNTGSIHDIADVCDRQIKGAGCYAVVLASYYGGKGYTTHKTAEAAIRKSRSINHSHQIIDSNGNIMAINGDRLVIDHAANC